MSETKKTEGVSTSDLEFREGDSAPVVGNPAKEATILEPSVPDTLTISYDNNEETSKDEKLPFENLGSLCIRPFVADKENMGLEAYGFVIFEGTAQQEQLACIEKNGVVRYITGLDEFAPEVQLIKDKEKKKSIILNIRKIVTKLEAELATNILDIEDKEFWNKVKRLRPDNHEFWSTITISCTNRPFYLNHKTDPFDLIKLMAIEAGGFDLVAKSYDDAQARPQAPKFFLDKEIDTVSTRTQYKKLRNSAIGLLEKLFTSNPKKLLYVTKIVEADSTRYKNTTPIDILYETSDEFIAGLGSDKNKTRCAETFIKTANLDIETLKLKALVKDASFYKFISLKADGAIYHVATGEMVGKNLSDIVENLKNPLHEDVCEKIIEEVEYYWNQ